MKIDALRLQIAAVTGLLKLLKQDLKAAEAAEQEERAPRQAKQAELPAIPPPPAPPPRAKSRQQHLHDEFQERRKDVLDLDLNAPFEPDEAHGPAFINTALAPIIEAFNGNVAGVEELMEAFFLDPWASSLKPPFPFKAFVSNKIYPRLMNERRARIQNQKQADQVAP